MGTQHFVVVRLKDEIANIYEELGEWTKSELLRREVYAAYVEHRGAENEFTVGKEYLLALSLLGLGHKEEARNHVVHILEIRERLYDPQDALTQKYHELLVRIGPVERQPMVGSQTANALTSFRIGISDQSVPSGTSTTGAVRRVRRPPKSPPTAPRDSNDS